MQMARRTCLMECWTQLHSRGRSVARDIDKFFLKTAGFFLLQLNHQKPVEFIQHWQHTNKSSRSSLVP